MNVKLKTKRIFGKEFTFKVEDEDLDMPTYQQIRGIIKGPSWLVKMGVHLLLLNCNLYNIAQFLFLQFIVLHVLRQLNFLQLKNIKSWRKFT